MGRPKKENRRTTGTVVRLNEEEVDMIKEMMYETDFNKSEIIRRAIKMFYYNSRKY